MANENSMTYEERETSDRESLCNLIKRYLVKRKATIQTLTALEDAWKSAMYSAKGLNRPLLGSDLPEQPEKETLLQASSKKRAIEMLSQKTFLLFQNFTENKNEEQLESGKELITLLKIKTTNHETLALLTNEFYKKENHINKILLKNVKNFCRESKLLLEELEKTRNLPCRDTHMELLLQHDLDLIKEFLKSTQELLTTSTRG